MLRSVWQKWLHQLSGRAARRPVTHPAARGGLRPQVELLEGRVVPAGTITIVPGAAGSESLDGFLSPTDGTIDATDGGAAAGRVSTGALLQVLGNVDINITALDGITFANLGGALVLNTQPGRTATFTAQGNTPGTTITFSNTTNTIATAGGTLAFSTPNNLTAAALNANGGDITLNGNVITLNQPVTAGNRIDIAAAGNVGGTGAVTAANLSINSATGINLPAANVSNLDYTNATSGAVNVTNVGGLTVTDLDGSGSAGNLGAGVGATTNLTTVGGPLTFAVNTSGTANFTATAGDTGQPGDDLTVLPGVTVGGGANVTLTAGDNFQLPAGATVSAVGDLTLTAGINADGFGAMNLFGTVVGGGLGRTHSFTAQQDVTLGALVNLPASTVNVTSQQGALVDANGPTNNFVATTLNLFAARGIGSSVVPADPIEVTVANLRAENTFTGDVLVTNLAGDLTVRGANGGNGPFTITLAEANRTLTVNPAGILTGVSGAPITLVADNMTVQGPVNAGAGTVTLQPLTAARAIDLGSDGGGTRLGLTDAELDFVTSSVTRIGGPAQQGSIAFAGPVTAPLGRTTRLNLQTAGTITQTAGSTVVGPGAGSLLELALQGASGVNLPLVGNNADAVAGLVTAPGAGFTYVDTNTLAVGTVDNVVGVRTNAATIDIETFASGALTVNSTVDSTGGNVLLVARGTPQTFTLTAGSVVRSGGGTIAILADNMSLNGPAGGVNSGIGRTTLRPNDPGVLITLGGPDSASPPVALGLTAAELNTVTAGTLQVGDATSGSVSVVGSISPGGVQVLSLQTSGAMSQNAGATITVPNLAIRAGNAVTLTQGNNVTTGSLAATVTTGGQGFSFSDVNDLTIGTVDGLAGIVTSDAPIALTAGTGATPGNLTINSNLTAKAGAITLTAAGADARITNNAVISNTTGRPVVLTADRMALGVGSIGTTGDSRVTIRTFTPARQIDLGSNTDLAANTLELSSNELFSILFSPGSNGALQIGDSATITGTIAVTAPVAVGAPTLALINNGQVNETGAGSISVTNLRVSSTGPVNLTGTNTVDVLSALVTGPGSNFTYSNLDDLIIGNVDGVSGITTTNGQVTVGTLDGDLTLLNNIVAGANRVNLTAGGAERTLTIRPLQVSGNSAALVADRIVVLVQGAPPTSLNVGSTPANVVTINTFSAGRPINLGAAGDPTGVLNLTDTELDTITAGVLRIGSPTSGPITVSDVITESNSATALSLITGSTVTSTAAGALRAATLAIQAAGGVDLTLKAGNSPYNLVNTALAGTTAGTPFRFVNGLPTLPSGDLFVGTVDGVVGISTAGGLIDLQTNAVGGTIGVSQPLTSGNGNITLTADDLDVTAAINGGTGLVNVKTTTPARTISVGTNAAGTMSLVDAELDRVTARVLRIGSTAGTGNVNVGGTVTQAGGGYAALSLVTGSGAINDTTPLEQTDLFVSDLALTAGAGIGSGNDLNVSVTRLAANNTNPTAATTGAVQITGAQSYTIVAAPGIDGVAGVTNNGPGAITLRSTAGLAVAPGAVIRGGTAAGVTPVVLGGTVTLVSNLNNPLGTANVDLGAGAQILTRGDVVITADPDGNGVGGTITSGAGVVLSGPGGPATNITLTAATDLALPALAAATSITATSTGGSLRDDGLDTTIVDAPTVTLNARGDVGGAAAITVADVLSGATAAPTAAFLGAIDLDLVGLTALAINQNAATPGNVQLRGVNGVFNTSLVPLTNTALAGKQLALIGGDNGLTVDAALTVPAAANAKLLLGAVNSAVTVNAPVTNGGTERTDIVSAGAGVQLNAGVAGGANSPVTVRASGGSIVDGNGAGVTNVTGGAVNLQADAGGTIDADVLTTGLTAATTNAAINVRAEPGSPLPVAGVNAGTGTVSLSASNANVTDLSPNNLVAEVVGGTVNLTTTGTGTVGTAAAPLEIDATVLNATTANRNLWVTDVAGGVRIGNVNVGTGTATLGANAGVLQSDLFNGVADVTAANLVLVGTGGASFGVGPAIPLEVAVTTLSASTTGTGSIQVRDLAGGLTVTQATTANGAVSLEAAGPAADLTVVQVTAGTANTATLTASGAVLGTPGGAADVTAGTLVANAGAGVGTAGAPLETAAGTLAANGGAGGVAVSNRGALTISTAGVTATGDVSVVVPESVPAAAGDNLVVPAGATVSSTGGSVVLQAGDDLTLAAGGAVSAVGTVTLTTGANDNDGAGGTLTFRGTALGADVSVLGGNGPDTFVLNPTQTVPTLAAGGLGGADRFVVTPSSTTAFDVTGGPPSTNPGDTLDVSLATVTNPRLTATFTPGSGYSGNWTFGGAQPVSFNTIETLTPTSTLTVSITDNQATAVPGSTVVYTVTVANAGPSAANGAVLSFPVSNLLLNPTFTSSAAGGASGNTPSGSGNLTEVLNLPVGGSVTYTVTGRINPSATGSITNTVTVTAPATAPDLTGSVHTAQDTDTLTPQADVRVTTARVGAAPAPGGTLTYTVTVTNNGPSDARTVQFTDTLPANAVFRSVVQTSGPAFALTDPGLGNTGQVKGSIAVLPAGASATFTLTLKAFGTTGTQVPNNVTVTTATTDPVSGNNSATAPTAIGDPKSPPRIVVGTGNGGGPEVLVYNAQNNALLFDFFAYEESFRGGVNVAQGDVTGDGIPDIIAGTGVGGGPVVKVFDGDTGALVRSFLAYEVTFRGGVNVSTGDINGDGFADIFVGSGNGGGPVVKVFDGKTGAQLRSFLAYEDRFRGGVIVNAGDVNGDGFADIIAGTGVGGGPVVKVFNGVSGELMQSFFAYPDTLRGGVNVAGGDVNGDGFADIIVGAGVGGAPNVRVFDGLTGALVTSFFVFDPTIQGGVNVAATDVNGDGRADLIAGSGVGMPPQLSVYDAVDFSLTNSITPFDPSFTGGVFVG